MKDNIFAPDAVTGSGNHTPNAESQPYYNDPAQQQYM
jgi:hypothetical protein